MSSWRIRSLRAGLHRNGELKPVTPAKKRAETIQVALAIVTLLLVFVEWTIHFHLHHSI